MDETGRRIAPWAAAIAGMLAGGVAIAASEVLAGVIPGWPSLVIAIGDLLIALQPPGAKDIVVSLFGTNDKLALNVAIVVVALGVAAVAGIVAARRFWFGAGVFVVFGAVAAIAAAREPLVSSILAVLAATVSVIAGIVALRLLLGIAPGRAPADRGAATVPPGAPASPTDDASDDWTRRRFLIASAGTLGGVVVVGAAGRALLDSQHSNDIVVSTKLPPVLRSAAPPTPDQTLQIPGISPLVTPNDVFYRIDTALLVPNVDVESWRLEVTGMVDHPGSFSYDELLAMPLYEQYVTISCVSNRVGGDLVGNALWTGVRLKDVLEAAGVQQGATQIVGRSVDGFTAGFPTAWALEPDREPLIVVGMDRKPLPLEHGFPARLIVPGLYGYVSATKWLSEIQLTTREAVDGYWVPLGWAKDAPILTQSRIDVPTNGARLAPGTVEIGGVAWAPDRGISAVEVRIDDGQWQPARMSTPLSDATWVQWVLTWTAPQGQHSIEVRATDGTGTIQTDERTEPAPDGARGHHRISVTIG
jgi:DMSO/TMAO reductase YedYZ molybdopterin-dependent catalytic subunit